MKAAKYILTILLCLAVVGLLCYEAFVAKNLESGHLTKGVLIIAGAVVALFRPAKKRPVANKKALYQKAYSEFIQNTFSDDPKLEKKFYAAVHDYNNNKPSAAVVKLKKLRHECQRTSDLRSVTVFTALCLDDMQCYEEAIRHYDAALKIRDSSTLHSNMGLCYQRLGKFEDAEAAYLRATQSNEKNAIAWNNLSSLYFKQGAYEDALDYAEQAIEIDSKMPQALSTAAICSHLVGSIDDYEYYYRQAVANGYDGAKIKRVIQMMDSAL